MQLTSQQVKDALHVGDARLARLVEEKKLTPVNQRKPDAKKFFARYDSKQVEALRKELKVANGAQQQAKPQAAQVPQGGGAPAILLRIEQKLDRLIAMWS